MGSCIWHSVTIEMFKSMKNTVKDIILAAGYRVVRVTAHENSYISNEDERERIVFLLKTRAASEKNFNSGKFPDHIFIEKYFDISRIAMVRVTIDACVEAGVDFSTARVLDIGCHCGALLHQIARRYPSAILSGCDVSTGKTEVARSVCPEATIFLSTIQELPGTSKYDIVFLMQVLEHLVDPELAVRQMLALVPSGGHVILTVPDGRRDSFPAKKFMKSFGAFEGHVNFWSPESWRFFFEQRFPDNLTTTAQLPSGHLIAIVRSL